MNSARNQLDRVAAGMMQCQKSIFHVSDSLFSGHSVARSQRVEHQPSITFAASKARSGKLIPSELVKDSVTPLEGDSRPRSNVHNVGLNRQE
jgi:hypothetical protein